MSVNYHRHNPKKIALIVEIIVIILAIITLTILNANKVDINYLIVIIVLGILLFSFILTLSLIRYEAMRDIRDTFKDSNLPLYTDQTSLLMHDIKDEEDNK